jgi:hypothetical protein
MYEKKNAGADSSVISVVLIRVVRRISRTQSSLPNKTSAHRLN